MRLYQGRVLLFCLGTGLLGGGLIGALVGLVTGGSVVIAATTGIILVGGVAFFLGMFAAVEPPGGWASANKRHNVEASERRSLLTKLAFEIEAIDTITSGDLAIWAVVVGGGLIALGILGYSLGT